MRNSEGSSFSAQAALTQIVLAFYDQICIFTGFGKGEACNDREV